ncbi:hypothetical protein GQ457_14G002890 [Hibiscus cannabinus]
MMVQCGRQLVRLLWLFLIFSFLVCFCRGSRSTKAFRIHPKSQFTGHFLGFLPRHFPIPASPKMNCLKPLQSPWSSFPPPIFGVHNVKSQQFAYMIKRERMIIYNQSNTIPVKRFDFELKQLSSNEAARLEKPFSEDEIWAALSTVESSKASGPDGFNMGFLKKFWAVLKADIMDFFNNFYKGCIEDFSFNHSFIVLIPKIRNPVGIEDFRPISLVGCVYKLLSKVLALRLGEILGTINNSPPALAYDTIDWGFLMVILKKMGFGLRWCQWISMCISTAYISVLVNGSPTAPFAISRGLRQGCPLSPMLFNLVAEALSAILKKATSYGFFFPGFHIGQKAVEVSHLQFADDLIVFCGAEENQIKNVDLKVDWWAALLHCNMRGFPVSWKYKTLSFGGRIALVKSVLVSLPIYFISIFQMPAAVNTALSSKVANFLWGSLDSKAIHWIRWDTICLPKSCGGLGLVNFKVKNRALLNKWLWRFGVEVDSLWRKVVSAKYEENDRTLLPLNRKTKNKSWIWQNIISPLSKEDDLFTQNI